MHTPLDAAALDHAGIDPDTVQPRERPVPCPGHGRSTVTTFNLAGRCDAHYEEPGRARAARTGHEAFDASPTFGIDLGDPAVRADARRDTLRPMESA